MDKKIIAILRLKMLNRPYAPPVSSPQRKMIVNLVMTLRTTRQNKARFFIS